jgi:hypothetical protein
MKYSLLHVILKLGRNGMGDFGTCTVLIPAILSYYKLYIKVRKHKTIAISILGRSTEVTQFLVEM